MFTRLGAIAATPFKSEIEEHGQIFIQLDFYKFGENKYDFAIKAKIAKQIFSRYPRPAGTTYSSISDARIAAYNALEEFCINNKLKKQFNTCLIIHPSLFD